MNLKSLILERDECQQSLGTIPTSQTSTISFWQRRINSLNERLRNFGKRYNCVKVHYSIDKGSHKETMVAYFTGISIDDAKLFILSAITKENVEIITACELHLGL